MLHNLILQQEIESLRKPIEHDEECLAKTENEKYCDCGLKTYREGYDRAISDVLSLLTKEQ